MGSSKAGAKYAERRRRECAWSSCRLALPAAATGLLALAGTAHAQAPEAGPMIGTLTLPRDLSLSGMFMNADHVVKGVMVGLALASVITWTVWLAKSLELFFAKRRLHRALAALASAASLDDARQRCHEPAGDPGTFLAAALEEIRLSADVLEKEGLKERIASRLDRVEAAYNRKIAHGTGILATIGATAPFVGLFGTVWGIMNSFIGIAKSHATNLAVVAPGLAEALLATAFGLAAAIPAVVFYNMLARSIAGYRALLGDLSAVIVRLVSRDLDRHGAVRKRAPKVTAAE